MNWGKLAIILCESTPEGSKEASKRRRVSYSGMTVSNQSAEVKPVGTDIKGVEEKMELVEPTISLEQTRSSLGKGKKRTYSFGIFLLYYDNRTILVEVM